jgi:uncharacterized protein involved in exopolysaccharide biosynthesis
MPRRVIFKESSETATETTSFEINLFHLGKQVLKRRRFIAITTFVTTLLTAAYLFLQPNLFTSTATILPSGKAGGDMSALKSLVGLGTPMMMSDENSSALFPVILKSNLVAEAILDKTYVFSHKGEKRSLSLPAYFDETDLDRLRKALREITTVKASQKTGEIALGVETEFPGFSREILSAYIVQLEDFNLNKRKSSARNNEVYLARQLTAMKSELEEAEDRLEIYQLANLDWASSGSPEIQKELGRLRREVEGKSSAYIMLQQQYEMAKLDAQKDVPIVRVLDAPSLPTQKSGPFRRNIILMTGLMSFMLLVFGVLMWEIAQSSLSGKNKEDFNELQGDILAAFPRTRTMYDRIRTSRNKDTIVTP